MVRSTIPVVCGQSLYSLLANIRLFHRQLVIFHLSTKLNHLAHHTIATPHCTMLCICQLFASANHARMMVSHFTCVKWQLDLHDVKVCGSATILVYSLIP